ncbi:TonB-linked outer membrane protein, SusC/RagA family [Mucilaginibacter pineti]|uniref:TonB-linked outer membrane protein, SusC/RagA family n=1 Tax=Mucilaginibacter pineti TaxID=1391627 RepID=A0A1G7LYP8_9SPHI|nr:TonB-dependent receptor [Mucilaginibacter pineti]SDF54504.1 TonB-linked outer membrane protein, SusC/RagA family [Mucilaginibacter pineti]
MNERIFTYLKVKYLYCFFLLLLPGFAARAQSSFAVSGKITDNKGLVLPGVSVTVKGTTIGTISDNEGKFALKAPSASSTLVFSFIGFVKQEVAVKDEHIINIVLLDDNSNLNEVVVVAYGVQKKESMVSSITTISPKELKGPTSNLTTMLAGRVAGLISYQRSGEPGADNASFFIRGITSFGSGKIDPLILIDGMESTSTNLARLQPDDIAGFSILKDAAASSLYGARGANGVILVTTKSGKVGDTKFNVRFENSTSSNTQNFALADNITYMKLANEAALTRNPLSPLPYTQNKIDHTQAGDNPLLYPSNNWIGQLIKNYTNNQRFNLNLSGGVNRAQYYIAATANQDNGVLKAQSGNNFNNNVNLKSYEIRSNVNVKLTSSTEAILRTSGDFDDYNGPIGGGGAIFASALNANPVLFPATFPASDLPLVKHPLFGNAPRGSNGDVYDNPYADMVSGFQQYSTSTLNVQVELKQDLKFITEGLSARGMVYTQRYSYFNLSRQYNPFYYSASPSNTDPRGYNLNLLNETTATEYLNYKEGNKTVNTTTYGEVALNYNRTFNKVHNVSGLLIGIQRNYLTGNAGDLQSSLPFRNQGVSGRLTYGYNDRYLFETNFGYNGSERFAKNNRYGFFPSVGVAWNVNNEKFFEPLSRTITKLKFRATYGLVGNDQIGNVNDRFFYLSNVNLSDGNFGSYFGENYAYSRPGVSISRYSNTGITWEKSKKTNIGMDLGLFDALNIVVDAYKEHRSNILMQRAYIPTTLGLTAPVSANVGVAEGKGVDVSMDYNKNFGNTWLQMRGTFTYAASKLLVNEEPNYPSNMQYLSRVGQSLGEVYGLVAERLFVDDEDVKNSPKQNYGEVRGGDIKYRDLNGDGQITDLDMINGLGYPTTPEIIYGFGFSFGYKNFDISTFFQGSARSSFFIDPSAVSPFVTNGANQHGLLDVIAQDHWSEDNRNLYALWPRLSLTQNANNNQPSNWWMRDGAFLRMKTAEIGYSIKEKTLRKFHISSLRFYANGSNLFLISAFKLWDPEQGSNGLGYPIQKVFNVGLNIQL